MGWRRTEGILYGYFRELHFASFERNFKKQNTIEKDKIDYYIDWLRRPGKFLQAEQRGGGKD